MKVRGRDGGRHAGRERERLAPREKIVTFSGTQAIYVVIVACMSHK